MAAMVRKQPRKVSRSDAHGSGLRECFLTPYGCPKGAKKLPAAAAKQRKASTPEKPKPRPHRLPRRSRLSDFGDERRARRRRTARRSGRRAPGPEAVAARGAEERRGEAGFREDDERQGAAGVDRGGAGGAARRAEAPALEFGEFASALRWIATASELELRDLFDHKPELRRSVDVLWRECKASTREGPGFDASALEMADDLLGGGFHGDEAGDAAVYLGGAGRDDATQDTQQSFGDEAGLDDSGGELFEPRDDDPRDAAARDDDDDDFRASAAADALLDDDGLEDATRDLIAQGTELLDSTRDLLEEPARDGGFDDTFGGGGAFDDGADEEEDDLDDLRKVNA
ncbi:hypothetical protein JL720_10863 [Aureococcus anophagefferens]|nr:hypothetical protein JL720_10863 [Aureococcus anophagefferens]